MSDDKRWMIKNPDGTLRGPLTTEKVLSLISKGDLSGEEMISIYPGAKWMPLSKDPVFYDRLLEILEQEQEKKTAAPVYEEDEPAAPPPEEPSPQIKIEDEITAPIQVESLQPEVQTRTKSKSTKRTKKTDDIELVDVQKKVKAEVLRRAWLPALVTALILFAGFYLFFSGEETVQEERIHLLVPRKGQAQIAADQVTNKGARAAAEFVRDTFSGYAKAQNELVQIVEGANNHSESMALLCLTYYELWPYAFQDSADLKAISAVTQMVSAVDGAGLHASTCKTVDLLIKGRMEEARSLSSGILDSYNAEGSPPVLFYYFMAIFSEAKGDLQTAIAYMTTAQQQWPQWLRAFSFQAQLFAKLEMYTEAAKTYRAVLQANPNHEAAKIELGIIEYKHFRNLEKGIELIRSAVQSGERLTRRQASRGYFGLAEIYLQKRDNSQALEFAKKAYARDSTNNLAKNLVIQLGGSKELSRTKFKAYQLIAEGDQFFREGDCNAAQAHYKAAYEADNKSAIAAMKAGECLWRLSLTTEAIEWMNKALRADANLIEAYVTLADYYSQRYNFVYAAQVLLSAQRVAPKSYEVFRGFALIEYRRNNFNGAVNYAKQALAIYDMDVDAHVILAESLFTLKDMRQAYAHAVKACEIDVNNRRAQIIYGRTLGGVQGTEAAITYLTNLVNDYPKVIEYRMALGKQLLDEERFAESEAVFSQLIQIDEKAKEAYLYLGKILIVQSQYEKALEAFLQAAVLDPADAEPLFQTGLLYLQINKPQEAQAQFQRVLRTNKLYPLVHYHLGRAALMMGNGNEALNEAREERNLNPNLPEAYLLAAEAYTLSQQYSLCVVEYQKAVKLKPQSAEIYVKMAQCYRKADQLDVAIAMLNQAATQESGMPDIYRELGIIYEMKGDLVKAVEAYNQYFVLNPNAADRSQIEQRVMGQVKKGR